MTLKILAKGLRDVGHLVKIFRTDCVDQ